MSTITGPLRLVFPDEQINALRTDTGGNGDFTGGVATTVAATATDAVNGNRTVTGNTWLDDGAIVLDSNNAGLTARNAYIRCAQLHTSSGVTVDDDTLYWDFEDCVIEITNVEQTEFGIQGAARFVNCTIYTSSTTGRAIFGNNSQGAVASNRIYLENCRVVAPSTEGSMSLLTQFISTNSSLQGSQFVQNANIELNSGFGLGGVTASSVGGVAQLPAADAGKRWAIRHTHFLAADGSAIPSGNVDSTNTGTSTSDTNVPSDSYTPMSNIDFSAGLAGITVNRNASAWYINPIPEYVITVPQNITVTNHSTNSPSGTDPAEIRTFVGWRPFGRDSEDNSFIPDYKVDFGSGANVVSVPSNDDVPSFITGDNIFTVSTTDDRGFWIQDRRYLYMTNGSLPDVLPVRDIPYTHYSFTHNIPLSRNTNLPTRPVTIADGSTQNVVGSANDGSRGLMEFPVSLVRDQFIADGRTTDNATGTADTVSTFDQLYEVMKLSWYSSNPSDDFSDGFGPLVQEFTITDGGNRVISLGKDLTLLSSGSSSYLTADYQVLSNSLSIGNADPTDQSFVQDPLIAGINANGNTVDLNGSALPANSIVRGGTWTGFLNNVNNVAFGSGAADRPTLNLSGINRNLQNEIDIRGWNSTGLFDIRHDSSGTILIVSVNQAVNQLGFTTASDGDDIPAGGGAGQSGHGNVAIQVRDPEVTVRIESPAGEAGTLATYSMTAGSGVTLTFQDSNTDIISITATTTQVIAVLRAGAIPSERDVVGALITFTRGNPGASGLSNRSGVASAFSAGTGPGGNDVLTWQSNGNAVTTQTAFESGVTSIAFQSNATFNRVGTLETDGDIELFLSNHTTGDDYRVIWRPRSTEAETTIMRLPYSSGFPTASQTIPIETTLIPSTLISTEGIPDGVRMTWTTPTDTQDPLFGQLIGTITGADATSIPGGLNGSQTQSLMRSAYTSNAYLEILLQNLHLFENVAANDYVIPASPIATFVEGSVLELTTDGNPQVQQAIEAVTDADLNGVIVDQIVATIGGTTFSFPSVQINRSQAGISGTQVRESLGNQLDQLNTNVIQASVKPPAVQRAQGGGANLPTE